MAWNWLCVLVVILLVSTCVDGRVRTNSGKAGRGRHTMGKVPSGEKPTEGKGVGTKKLIPSEAEACEGIKCGPGKICELATGGEVTCVCNKHCPRDRANLLCASDGLTYTSECELNRAACRNGLSLSVVHEGRCQGLPTEPPLTTLAASPRRHPIACYQDQRDTLHREVVEWLQVAHRASGIRPYETVLQDFFTEFDDSKDGFLEPTEFLEFVEHNETLRKATDDLNQDLEEDTLLRGLCVDALLAEADENLDWRLSLAEFMKAMVPGFSPPSRMCSLEGEYFTDGEEKKNKCNLCICACGNWVCTANACDGSLVAGQAVESDKNPGDKKVSKSTWVEVVKKLSSLAPLNFPTRPQNVSQLVAEMAKGGDGTAVDPTSGGAAPAGDGDPQSDGEIAKEAGMSFEGALASMKDSVSKTFQRLGKMFGKKRSN